jgi:hypothetical protein
MNLQTETFQIFTQWITFLWQALPLKLQPTLLELLFGAMISRTGHITSAILAIHPELSWTAYYKAIEKGRFAWLALAKQWLLLLLDLLPDMSLIFAIDDTIGPRSSTKAPAVGLHFDHSQKNNRPRYIWGQMRVTLSMICCCEQRAACLPLLIRLIRPGGNRTKLDAARLLMYTLGRFLKQSRPMTLLLDAWYTKAPLMLELIKKGITVIGQVRRDTALFLEPISLPRRGRGRPRKYGAKLTFAYIKELCLLQHKYIYAYGKIRSFQFYGICAKVRFLNGLRCRMVWCRFLNDKNAWTGWYLLLSTDCSLADSEIIRLYALRWWTEPMFNELKNLFGLANAWEQTRQVLARWTMVLSLAYSLPRLLALIMGPIKGAQMFLIPWRENRPVTAGWIAEAISQYFRGFPVRTLWDRKSRKINLQNCSWNHVFQRTG